MQFSGHGTEQEEIIPLDQQRKPKPVRKEALASLFRTLRNNIRVVLLNACFSRPQALAITDEIDCAIGMKRAIGDKTAIVLAASFYRAIGFGCSVQQAFDQGKTALLLEGIAGHRTPSLMTRKKIKADSVVLINSPQARGPHGGSTRFLNVHSRAVSPRFSNAHSERDIARIRSSVRDRV